MDVKPCQIVYLPLFENDLEETYDYIADTLRNAVAAKRLVLAVRDAIHERAFNPTGFKPYEPSTSLEDTYYRINVGNYSVFYVVFGHTMEVRRLIYSRRDLPRLL